MKVKTLAFLACRVLSIVIFIKTLVHSYNMLGIGFIQSYRQGLGETGQLMILIIMLVGPLLVLLLSSIILWVFADKISSLMIVKQSEEDTKEDIREDFNYKELQIVGFSVVGLVILATAIPQIFNIISRLVQFNSPYMNDIKQFKIETIFMIIEKAIQLVIASVLLFGSKSIVGSIQSIRKIGTGLDEKS